MEINEFEMTSAKRKRLVESGEVPEWYTTQGLLMFERKYSYNGETVREAFKRVANHLGSLTPKISNATDRFFDLMWSGKLAPSTPVLCNTGTSRGHPVSCSGGYFGDSIDEFYKNHHENAMLSKNGYGTSSYLGSVRPRGTKISSGGEADGVVPQFDSAIDVVNKVSQGNNRRGNWAGYLEVDHEDFYELAGYIQKNPATANVGWIFTDAFIERLKSGDEEAIARFSKVCYLRARSGKGYIWKSDTANRNSPQAIKNSGISIKGSNLCVAPETLVLTDSGHIEISELESQSVNVWNGTEWSLVDVVKTGDNQKLISVETDCGQTIECTPYHKFYIQKTYSLNSIVEVRAIDLKEGDKLIKFELPVINGDLELTSAYENGFFSGDGCKVNRNGRNEGSRIYLYGEKRNLISEFDDSKIRQHAVQGNQDREYFYYDGLKDKFFVPDSSYTVESRLKWLAGYLDADGTVARTGESQTLQAACIEKNFLVEVQSLLQTLGIQSKVCHARDAGNYKMPANDGTGENKAYNCQEVNRLLISGNGIVKLISLGFKTKRLKISERVPQRSAERFVKIKSIEDHGRIDDTFCFTEPKRGMGVFNGILTGQCSEISLPEDSDHTFSCVLSSWNLYMFNETTDEDIRYMIYFLDAVVTDMLNLASGKSGFKRIVRFTEKSRAIGLGTLGLHSLFQKQMLPFDSFEARILNTEIYSKLKRNADKASIALAKVYGEPEWCKGTGMRNATTIAIAPNTSSALLCGGMSQSIEPIVANAYNQPTAAGEMTRMNPAFVALLKEKGLFTLDLMKSIAVDYKGSVQHLEFLTDHEKLVFRTAYEIDQMSLLQMASSRQKYIDQGQSVNFFFSPVEIEIATVLKELLLDDLIKGAYYQRALRGSTGSTGECIACHA